MLTRSSITVRSIGLVALFLLAACGDEATAPAPGIQPQITNNTDAFSYQLTDLDGASGSWDYTWQNTGTFAKVRHASNAGGTGTAVVTVKDATGTQVYTGPFASSGEIVSSPAGVAGAWSITVLYTNYSNTQVSFSVVKQ